MAEIICVCQIIFAPLRAVSNAYVMTAIVGVPLVGAHAAHVQEHNMQEHNNHNNAREPRALPEPLPEVKEWHSRGYLPHREFKSLQFITFRLYDSVPAKIVRLWKDELLIDDATNTNDPKMQELRKRIDKYEDAGYGQCFLKDERIAELVQNNLLHFDGERYRLIGWCIMPNHVHVLIEVMEGWTLSLIMHGWRSYTAHEANRILNRTGDFWQNDYFDRYIRSQEHFNKVVGYIDNNPLKAGLTTADNPWRWSSANLCRSCLCRSARGSRA